MTKDIFGDDYFSRHRDTSEWDSLKGRSISRVLNLKNKSKPKLDEILPVKISKSKSSEDIIDSEFKEHTKLTAKWKKGYIQSIIAGTCGGLIFYLTSFITTSENLFSQSFWVDTLSIVLVALIIVIILGLFYKVTDERV